MGRVWGMDAVSKNRSTSDYGNIVSLTESTLEEGLIYVGTDDGLIQVTEDGGGSWRKTERFSGNFSTEANMLLTRNYRRPFVVPAEI